MPTIRTPRTLPTASIGGGVSLVPVTLTITPPTTTKAALATQQLTAVVTDAGGNVLTVQQAVGADVLSAITITYESDDTDVATVSASGLITAVATGTCTVTATISGTSITDTCAVTVT